MPLDVEAPVVPLESPAFDATNMYRLSGNRGITERHRNRTSTNFRWLKLPNDLKPPQSSKRCVRKIGQHVIRRDREIGYAPRQPLDHGADLEARERRTEAEVRT